MSCEHLTIACAIERLGASLTGWDWPEFASTLVATVVGGLLSLFVALLLYQREVADRHRSQMDSALSALLVQMRRFANDRASGGVPSPGAMSEALYGALLVSNAEEASALRPLDNGLFWAGGSASPLIPQILNDWAQWLQDQRRDKKFPQRATEQATQAALEERIVESERMDYYDVTRKRYY